MTARKHDRGKPRWCLVPWDAMAGTVQVLTHGAEKYDDHNWAQGTAYSRYFDALMRHLTAWWGARTACPPR